MSSLETLFPSLSHFSDIDWEAIGREYESTSIGMSFPEFLQRKALEGDCPPYIYELAYFELAAFSARTAVDPFPYRSGIYLNPTAHFLDLTFDVPKMLEEAAQGRIEVTERPQVLCLYRDRQDEVNSLELDKEDLLLLEQLEDGPQPGTSFVQEEQRESYLNLVKTGLILEIE